MPKVRGADSLSSVQRRSSPYAVSSNHTRSCKNVNSESAQNIKEWEDARCSICMEHPHNAVLLKCSSDGKGCRPYMCNTSYRHSNCFEQFCKLYGPIPLTTQLQEISFTSVDCVASHRQMDDFSPVVQNGFCGNQLQSKLICPLCRGGIYGYTVVEPARQYMNSKVRSCSSETCDYNGTYTELRKHARSEHPYVRPAEVDPVRHHDWVRLQNERDIEDLLSIAQSDYDVHDEESSLGRVIRFLMSSFASEMFDSFMDLLSDNAMDGVESLQEMMDNAQGDTNNAIDASRGVQSLHEMMENVHGDTDSNSSTRAINNFSLESRPHSQHTRWLDLRSSQHMPRAIQPHGQNQRQRAAEGTSRSQQLHWRRQTPFGRHQRSFESTSRAPQSQPHRQYESMSNSIPRASQLRWRNHRWSPSSYHNER